MSIGQHVADLLAQVHDLGDRKPAACGKQLSECPSRHHFHGDVEVAVELALIVDVYDLRMVQPAGDLGLSHEAIHEGLVPSQALRHDLDRYLAAKRLLDTAVDHAHPTVGDFLHDAVVA